VHKQVTVSVTELMAEGTRGRDW